MPQRRRSAKNAGLKQLASLAADYLRERTRHPSELDEMAVCLAVARSLLPTLSPVAWRWIEEQLPDVCKVALRSNLQLPDHLQSAAQVVLKENTATPDPLAHFYEWFLKSLDKTQRVDRGVFYTPLPLVRSIINNVDRALCTEFDLADGLQSEITWRELRERTGVTIPTAAAPTDPVVRMIDPALGAGLFLTEIIRHARQRHAGAESWNRAARQLLSRLGGVEILPTALVIATVRIAATLEATGYGFPCETQMQLTLGDALAAPIRPAWTIIVGNPPFSGISSGKHPWVEALLRGQGAAGESRVSYFDYGGAPLGERKHWLHDDYVKFLRVAHEQIETTGLGILGFVTSHGYLDNITFRALREKLLETFPRVSVIDLHGNAKRRERTPDGERDENVFGIESGIAIGLFRKPPVHVAPRHERSDLWGTASAKLVALEACKIGSMNVLPPPTPPDHAFHATATGIPTEYAAGWPINEAMPVQSTAPVTARDAFVVADNYEELAQRCRDFCDPAIDDEEIRRRYFQRTRSRLYLSGDTRGWKLSEARKQMQSVGWRDIVQRVQYRPFDERVMLWAPWLIDWPRGEVTSHLCNSDNRAIITRRQSPPGQPWTYVWITTKLALDGVIRSDNRGSESLFPLWLYGAGGARANFAADFVTAIARATNLEWNEQATASDDQSFNAEQLFHFIYALLHSQNYRDRYQALLAANFPRILLPRSAAVFYRMAQMGARLAAIQSGQAAVAPLDYHGRLPTQVAAGYPRHLGDRLYLNASDCFSGVSLRTWQFRVGTYQVCQKLLKRWRGRTMAVAEVVSLATTLARIRRTMLLQRGVDRWTFRHEGFCNAFGGEASRHDTQAMCEDNDLTARQL